MKTISRKWMFLVWGLASLALAPGRADAAITFALVPQAGVDLNNLAVGQTFTLAITATLADPRDNFEAFAAGVSFGGMRQVNTFRVNSITGGDLVSDPSTLATSIMVRSFFLRLAPAAPIATSGTIAYISLTALTPDGGAFFRYNSEFRGAPYGGLNSTGFDAAYSVVPEPASAALLGMGMLGALAAASRRRDAVGVRRVGRGRGRAGRRDLAVLPS